MSSSSKGAILITGANGGLGTAIVKHVVSQANLAAHYGLYVVKDATTATALRGALAGHPEHVHDVLEMDLTRMGSVRRAAETINTRVAAGEIPTIRALILNAGYQNLSTQVEGPEGLDPTFTVNYLGHWLFVLLLLKSMDKEFGRIVVVGSQVHE